MKITAIIPGLMAAILIAGLSAPAAANGPAQVKIDLLSKDFVPVDFDHAGHVEMIGDCGSCHHHTTGTPSKNPDCGRCHDTGLTGEKVACRDCHSAEPFSAETLKELESDRQRYHRDIPGLKGALHRNCMGCHEQDGGPTGCLDCHPRTDTGNALFRAGKYKPAPAAPDAH